MITSIHNPRIQRLRAILAQRQEREKQKAFAADGVRLVEEANLAGWTPLEVFYTTKVSERGRKYLQEMQFRKIPCEEIPVDLMQKIADTDTPQGLIAVLPLTPLPLPKKLDFLLILDQIRDPGNLGTILRSAAAGGVQAVFLTSSTTDAFAPKVLRAGMGAHFRLPILNANWETIQQTCGKRLKFYLAEAENGIPCWESDLTGPLALIIGGEADGAGSEARCLTDQYLTIPMPGKSESLNAAVSAGILIFEVTRQRMLR